MIKTVNKPIFQENELFEQIYNKSMTELREQGFKFISKDDYSKICKSIAFLIDTNQINTIQEISMDAVYECFNDTEIADLDFKPSYEHTCQDNNKPITQTIEKPKNNIINLSEAHKKMSIKDRLLIAKASSEKKCNENDKKQNRSSGERDI